MKFDAAATEVVAWKVPLQQVKHVVCDVECSVEIFLPDKVDLVKLLACQAEADLRRR